MAQDYTVTAEPGRLWEEPPQGATRYDLGEQGSTGLQLPFDFQYYGELFDDILITTSGIVKLGTQTAWINHWSNIQDQHLFPIAPGSPADGVIAIMWEQLGSPTSPGDAHMRVWTSGTAPERRWVVAWFEHIHQLGTGTRFNCQVQLHEATGRIVFAWEPETSWAGARYSSGLDSPGDSRFTSWIGTGNTYQEQPGADYRFDPRTTTHTGSLVYDRPTTTANGSGAHIDTAAPLRRFVLELRRNGDVVANRVRADGAGEFSFDVFGAATDDDASLWFFTDNPACTVIDGNDDPYTYEVDSDVDLSQSGAVPTYSIAATDDATGYFRAPLRVADAILTLFEFVSARSETVPSKLDAKYSHSAGGATSYSPETPSAPAVLTIGGPGGSTPDHWDEARVMSAYARHVVAELAGPASTPQDTRFDAVSDPPNAFAQGLGAFLFAAATGESEFHDATSAGTVTSHDLESPTLASARGPAVAGWAAAALYDLLDAANESHDRVDGTANGADRVIAVLDALAVEPTPQIFVEAWATQFPDALEVVRIFVAHGLLTDDALEPNDDAGEPHALGAPGQRRSGLILNRHTEDWFSVELAQGVPALHVDARVEMSSPAAELEVQIRSVSGEVLATGNAVQGSIPVSIASGAVGPGTYHVRVRHVSGAVITPYTVQVYVPLTLAGTDLPNWTAGVPYNAPVTTSGGVPPHTLEGNPPPGLVISNVTKSVSGTPTQSGTFEVTVQVSDDGRPMHQAALPQTVVINPPLDLGLPAYVPLVSGTEQAQVRYDTGGTPPLRFFLSEGELPAGISFDSSALEFSGTPGSTGTADVTITGDDAVGASDEGSATLVVCAPVSGKDAPADVAATDRAAGYFVDAVFGSTISLKAKTAKKRAKRGLGAVAAGPDGRPIGGAKVKGGIGKASASFVSGSTGRHFVVLPADPGEATQILATVKVTPPKSVKGSSAEFGPGTVVRVEVGALAGATLTFQAKADKKSGVTARIGALLAPDGQSVPIDELVTTKGTKSTLKAALPSSGTWAVLIVGVGGDPGTLGYKAVLKQPKGVVFTLD